jgi:hypothetical protein
MRPCGGRNQVPPGGEVGRGTVQGQWNDYVAQTPPSLEKRPVAIP